MHVRLHTLGDGGACATDEDSVLLRIRIAPPDSPAGSLFSTERRYAARDLRSGSMQEALARLHEGDSMSIIAPGSTFPWSRMAGADGPVVHGEEPLRAELLLMDLVTPREMEERRDAMRAEDPRSYELRLIAEWLEREGEGAFQRWGNSMVFFRVDRPGEGTLKLSKGDRVSISCIGVRLEDGVVVDDTERHGGSYDWRYGDTDQVINGLEIAAKLFGHGGSGAILLPSAYAFGERGVVGAVPPHCPLLYHVRSVTITPGPR
ncbi:MAG: FKBP-type peptidyl-prolyl cis-trans isomerase [Flavobacteriales bacterium]